MAIIGWRNTFPKRKRMGVHSQAVHPPSLLCDRKHVVCDIQQTQITAAPNVSISRSGTGGGRHSSPSNSFDRGACQCKAEDPPRLCARGRGLLSTELRTVRNDCLSSISANDGRQRGHDSRDTEKHTTQPPINGAGSVVVLLGLLAVTLDPMAGSLAAAEMYATDLGFNDQGNARLRYAEHFIKGLFCIWASRAPHMDLPDSLPLQQDSRYASPFMPPSMCNSQCESICCLAACSLRVVEALRITIPCHNAPHHELWLRLLRYWRFPRAYIHIL
jgi:hypothetical protein